MKMKIVSIVLVLISLFTFGQSKTVKYISDSSTSSEKIKLSLYEDNSYDISFFYGKYVKVGDTITFNSEFADDSYFKVVYSNPFPKSSKIKVNFTGNSLYYAGQTIFIGLQDSENGVVNYKTLIDYSQNTTINNEVVDTNKFNFEIDKTTKYIYLVYEEEGDKESRVERFLINSDSSQIDVNYKDSYNTSKINLCGIINPITNEIEITEKGRNKLLFKLVDDGKINKENNIKPIESQLVKKWSYPGKKVVEPEITQVAVPVIETSDYTKYKFVLKIENNLKNALKVSKTQPDKILVIISDFENKNIKNNFEKFIKTYQETVQYNMYDAYNPEYDKFNFYLASSKDKSELKKHIDIGSPSFIFLNADGSKLYHEKNNLTQESPIDFYILKSYYTELNSFNLVSKFDTTFKNSIKTDEIEKAFSDISKIDSFSFHANSDDTSEVVVPVVGTSDFTPPVLDKVEVKEETITDENKAKEAIIDVPAESYDYSVLKEKANLYKMTTTPEQVETKWKQLLDAKMKDQKLDIEVVKIMVKEFDNYGFSKILFNKNTKLMSNGDFKAIDYYLKNYKTINEYVNDSTVVYGQEFYPYQATDAVSRVLSNNFDRTKGNPILYDAPKVFSYFKKFIQVSNNDLKIHKKYIDLLKTPENKNEFVAEYDNYFNAIVKDNTSIIESLDAAYSKETVTDFAWSAYKQDFATEANNAAWFVFENCRKDPNQVKKAIRWSETSLKVENDNCYFLDTLAQFYYLVGEKQKALVLAQKAIDSYKKTDAEDAKEYIKVVEKMINGTYKID